MDSLHHKGTRVNPDEIPDPFGDHPLPDECPELPCGWDFDPAELEDFCPTPEDVADAVRLFSGDDLEVIMEDDERPRDAWTPSRIEALEYQERR